MVTKTHKRCDKRGRKTVEVCVNFQPVELCTLRFEVPADASDIEIIEIAEDHRPNLGNLELADVPLDFSIRALSPTDRVGARFVRSSDGTLVLG